MTFEIRLSDRAAKDLKALPRDVQGRVVRKLQEAAKDPPRLFRRLAGAKTYRLRVGDYRVLADIRQAEKVIEVAHIGHRRKVYD